MTKEEQVEFWQRHEESRRQIDKDFANLPHEKQLEITGEMRANHEAMRNTRVIKEGVTETLTLKANPSFVIGAGDIGVCCCCEVYNSDDVLIKHVEHHKLWYCQKPSCNCLCCATHREPCGYCMGCCAEEHGLGSHEGDK